MWFYFKLWRHMKVHSVIFNFHSPNGMCGKCKSPALVWYALWNCANSTSFYWLPSIYMYFISLVYNVDKLFYGQNKCAQIFDKQEKLKLHLPKREQSTDPKNKLQYIVVIVQHHKIFYQQQYCCILYQSAPAVCIHSLHCACRWKKRETHRNRPFDINESEGVVQQMCVQNLGPAKEF